MHDMDSGEDFHTEHTVVERIDPLIGMVLHNRFRVEYRLAAGGFGAVYRGTDLTAGGEVAIKLLHSALASDSSVVARFRQEGETLSKLRDPHTVTAIALGETPDGTLYIAMELLRGESLHERYRARGKLPWKSVVAIARAVCASLSEAHAYGVIHRDLKPANIHLEPRGDERDFVKVVDFGIAKLMAGGPDLTLAGQMIGTFDYMAPEQMVGGQTAGRADIYTLGVVMYEMIAGCRPFGDHTGPTSLLAAMLTRTPERLASRAIVPFELDDLVMRCLEREQQNRFASVDELARALDQLLHDDDGDQVTRIMTAVVPPVARGSAQVASIQSPPMDARGQSWQPPPVMQPRYDMSAQRAHDKWVGRIAWIAVLALAVVIAAIVAGHM